MTWPKEIKRQYLENKSQLTTSLQSNTSVEGGNTRGVYRQLEVDLEKICSGTL